MKGISMTAAALCLPLMLALTGCASFKEATMYGECNNKLGGGGECKAGFSVRWERPPAQPPSKFMASLLASSEPLPDAAQYVMDVAGSTIPYPVTGTMTVRLVDTSSGRVIASRLFNWVRSGTQIRAQDPNAINAWAYTYAQAVDSATYELTRFYSGYGTGLQKIAGDSNFEGVSVASYSTTFSGGSNCTTYPSPRLCQAD